MHGFHRLEYEGVTDLSPSIGHGRCLDTGVIRLGNYACMNVFSVKTAMKSGLLDSEAQVEADFDAFLVE